MEIYRTEFQRGESCIEKELQGSAEPGKGYISSMMQKMLFYETLWEELPAGCAGPRGSGAAMAEISV